MIFDIYEQDGKIPTHAIVRNVLPPDVLPFLTQWSDENMERLSRGNQNAMYNGLTIQYGAVDNSIVAMYMQAVRKVAQGALMMLFADDDFETDGVMINKWPVGMQLGLHADNAFYPSGQPNYTSWRCYSAVFYLNSDYEGGEFYFGSHDEDYKVIKPEANSLAVFSAGLESVHGVKPVTGGVRWTIPMWFTRDPHRFERTRIPQ